VLRVARCGVNSDFFDLGGRSVEAMMLAGRINADLNVRITMADLFRAPTVADWTAARPDGQHAKVNQATARELRR